MSHNIRTELRQQPYGTIVQRNRVNTLVDPPDDGCEIVPVPSSVFSTVSRLIVGFALDTRLSAACWMTTTFCGP
jgi:hypothetical protein